MKIALRKNVKGDGQVWDWFTDKLSGGHGFSHAELVFSDGLSLSATLEEGIRLAVVDYTNKDWWRFFDLNVTPAQELIMRNWAEKEVQWRIDNHAGYDKWGVLRFVLPFVKEHPEDYFCSEAVVACCQQIGMFSIQKAWKVSPNHLFALLKNTRTQ